MEYTVLDREQYLRAELLRLERLHYTASLGIYPGVVFEEPDDFARRIDKVRQELERVKGPRSIATEVKILLGSQLPPRSLIEKAIDIEVEDARYELLARYDAMAGGS